MHILLQILLHDHEENPPMPPMGGGGGMPGIWLWTIGRPSFHIGASGVVYALASFLFFSGIIRKNNKLISVSLFVVFIYGGMIWGLFPIIESISWEGHVSGAIAGLFLAFWFKKDGPQKMQYYYEIEEEIEKYNDRVD